MQFALQLSLAERKHSSTGEVGSATQTSETPGGTAGLTTDAVPSQSVDVLQLEVQRLAADRKVLVQKMQVCLIPVP